MRILYLMPVAILVLTLVQKLYKFPAQELIQYGKEHYKQVSKRLIYKTELQNFV